MTDYNSNFTYQPNNYNRLFNDKSFINSLLQEIRYKLGRPLMRPEKMMISNTLKNINPVIFQNKTKENIIKGLSDSIAEQIVKNPCKDEDDVNIHELLKSQIGVSTSSEYGGNDVKTDKDFTDQLTSSFTNQVEITSLLGNKSITDLQRIINPGLVKKNIYILLDSRYRILDNDGTTAFQWNFNNNELTTQGSVNAIGNIRDITSMRICPIRIPYNSNADNEYQRVTMLIQEFSAQSFIGQENRRFHFIFKPEVSDRWIDLQTDNFNDGYFEFRNPITRLETFTISFGSPLEQIIFDTDRANASILDAGYAAVTTFNTISPHNLETGDTVIISGFSTANSNGNDNNVVSAINKIKGHIITYIDLNSFSIPVNSTNIKVNGVGTLRVSNGSPVIIGGGTSFSTVFSVGDMIEILNIKYKILSIQSDVTLTLTTNYDLATTGTLSFKKNNIVTGLQVIAYFTSKRIFITLNLEYYASEETKTS